MESGAGCIMHSMWLLKPPQEELHDCVKILAPASDHHGGSLGLYEDTFRPFYSESHVVFSWLMSKISM